MVKHAEAAGFIWSAVRFVVKANPRVWCVGVGASGVFPFDQ